MRMLVSALLTTALFQATTIDRAVQQPLPHADHYFWSAPKNGLQVTSGYAPGLLHLKESEALAGSVEPVPQPVAIPEGRPFAIVMGIRNASAQPFTLLWSEFSPECHVKPLAGQRIFEGSQVMSGLPTPHISRLTPGDTRWQSIQVTPESGMKHIYIASTLFARDPPPGPYSIACHWTAFECTVVSATNNCVKPKELPVLEAPELRLEIAPVARKPKR